ncbi:glycoside hydrolase family 53 protein [Rhodohalobacter sp. 8-1]|uniref:glycoside hydrolase family 53 protein n=1 Tax=Rhodohalobacter sp. 8-1 TaxID=3131972 RepID=UPI0030ED52BF
MRLLFVVIFSLNATFVAAQSDRFYYGADLSYVNQMEDCGADYKRGGISEDPYKIFADLGTNLVRVRLWVDPSWWQEPLDQPNGVKPVYNNLEDVKKTIQRAKAEGMDVMLGLHYSDFWADPGRQLIPREWLKSAKNDSILADSVYVYTQRVLTELDSEGLMPEFIKVGNENNGGILTQVPEENGFEVAETIASGTDWQRNALLFNSGIQAVRDIGKQSTINPKIVLHWSNLDGVAWWYQQMIEAGVTDFDVIGFSYYYAWHGGSISQLETTVQNLVEQFPEYDVMAVETGYLWSDEYGGIINEPDPEYLPVVPGKQLEYMADYGRAVMRAGGAGVIFWEPAWVDTPCKTPWGTGSSHTHVAFFDPVNTNFMEQGGCAWPNREYYENLDAPKAIFKVDMTGQEVSGDGIYVTGVFTGDDDWELKQMADEGDDIYSYFTYLPNNSEGAFYFVNGENWDGRESVPSECADRWETDREYKMGKQETVFAYKWGSCEQVYTGNDINVIFKVDMANSGMDVSDGVYITGE